MLKVKNLTHLSKKKIEKRQPSVAFWLDFNQNFVLYRMNVISGR